MKSLTSSATRSNFYPLLVDIWRVSAKHDIFDLNLLGSQRLIEVHRPAITTTTELTGHASGWKPPSSPLNGPLQHLTTLALVICHPKRETINVEGACHELIRRNISNFMTLPLARGHHKSFIFSIFVPFPFFLNSLYLLVSLRQLSFWSWDQPSCRTHIDPLLTEPVYTLSYPNIKVETLSYPPSWSLKATLLTSAAIHG